MRILFVCLGNICRSPMAEFVFKDIVNKAGLANNFTIDSAATSSYNERYKETIHIGTKRILDKYNIPYTNRYSRALRKEDYEKYDLIIAMDESNINDIYYIFNDDKDNKISKLLEFANENRDISDPWYTGNFELTYSDIVKGCNALLEYIKKTY